MKIFIEVEISPEEVPLATELFRTLRALTDHVKTRDIRKLFQGLISRLEDTDQLEIVANEICMLLAECTSYETVFDDFSSAFMQIVCPSDSAMHPKNVTAFMLLLPRLQEPMKAKMRDMLANKVLKHLTIKRQVNSNRSDFLTHAEIFVALVNLEILPLKGAVSTICKLLRKPEYSCAGITILRRTVELCLPQLTEKCDSATLDGLYAALQVASEEEAYLNDIKYIVARMGWSELLQSASIQHEKALMPTPSCCDSNQRIEDHNPTIHGLFPLESYQGHKNTVFSMAYDEQRNELVSSGRDGIIITWTQDGEIVETLDLYRHYACSMDCSLQTLYACGVAQKEEVSLSSRPLPTPCIFCYKAVNCGWKEHGILLKESSKLISSIKAMSGGGHFVTAETCVLSNTDSSSVRLGEILCYHDVQSSFDCQHPVKQYEEHEDLVTCISLYPPSQSVFISGSRDSTIRVWDCRADQSIGILGLKGKTGKIHAHDSMITSLDADDSNMIVSCGLDGYVNHWDFRMISNKNSGCHPISKILLDGTLTLRVALGGDPGMAAVNTVKGLYLVDFTSCEAHVAESFPDKRMTGIYHELRWGLARKVLYAAGDKKRIDVYKFQ